MGPQTTEYLDHRDEVMMILCDSTCQVLWNCIEVMWDFSETLDIYVFVELYDFSQMLDHYVLGNELETAV